MATGYDPKSIEKKWQDAWEKDGVYRATERADQKFYGLIEFPYPSGEGLHVGHPRSYTAIDIITRKKRMEGKNVLYPIGWDAFGLPTENFAIKHKIKPQDATAKNIANFTRQLKSLGLGFDWSREINTTDPAYFKWTQWMFLQFFKHDLAYKTKTMINWCPKDKIGLANEEVIAGCCERCGTPVEKREKEQWMIAITKYADRLISDLDTVDYLDKIKTQQINWIGKSEGANVRFQLADFTVQEELEVFTTRPDTLFGATFLVVSPELAKKWMDGGWKASAEASAYIENALKRTETERANEVKEKTGVATGVMAINPANDEEIPIWVADYVLGNYGTGAIMAVPAHDERDFAFAKKFELRIRQVVRPPALATMLLLNEVPEVQQTELRVASECWTADGEAVNSGFLDGLVTKKAKEKIISWLEKEKKGERAVTYRLRDWVFSRQRYWGEPIPIIRCPKDGYVPVPDEQLPVRLPDVEAYEPTDTGESPLAKIREWVEVECPKCGGKAERETDTMPNWAGSSWYFLRYCDPKNDKEFASADKLKYWMPVDLYNGGMEHTTLHLLYSRFWYKFLWDIGAVPKECGSEPYKRRYSQGLIIGEGGEKMSKARGNVVNPDDVVSAYGADVLRLFEMFIGPFDQAAPWDTNGIEGVKRFLEKVWKVVVGAGSPRPPTGQGAETASLRAETEILLNQTIKKIGDDIEKMGFNTAVSSLMILTNALADEAEHVSASALETLLKLLAPFAPHITEELWHQLDHTSTIHRESWPTFDPSKLVAETFELVVQVNGKLRDRLTVSSAITEEEAKAAVLASEKVRALLAGKEPTKIIYVPGRLVSISV